LFLSFFSAIPVCIYARDQTLLEMAYGIQFSGARVMVVSSAGLWDKIAARCSDFDNIKTVIFAPNVPAGTPPPGSSLVIVPWQELISKVEEKKKSSVIFVFWKLNVRQVFFACCGVEHA